MALTYYPRDYLECGHCRRSALGKPAPPFHDSELVEHGFFIALTFGQQRWIKTLGIGHGEGLADSAVGVATSHSRKIGLEEPVR